MFLYTVTEYGVKIGLCFLIIFAAKLKDLPLLKHKRMAKKTNSTPPNDSIPKVTYKNMKMMNQMRTTNSSGMRDSNPRPTTPRDTSLYQQGFDYGVKNWQNPPSKPIQGEGYMFRGGRWEGQNAGKAANYKPVKQKSFLERLFGN